MGSMEEKWQLKYFQLLDGSIIAPDEELVRFLNEKSIEEYKVLISTIDYISIAYKKP